MGRRTSWKTPRGRCGNFKKNYLNEMELDSQNTLVDGFLTLAETRANSQKPTFINTGKHCFTDILN